jgi:hypothetical protein
MAVDLSNPVDPANPVFASDHLVLLFHRITLNANPYPDLSLDKSRLFLRISYRSSEWTTTRLPALGKGNSTQDINADFALDVTYSALVYDILIIDVLASQTLGSKLVSRTRVALRSLAQDGMVSTRTLSLFRKKKFDEHDYAGLTGLELGKREEPFGSLEMTATFTFDRKAEGYRNLSHPFHLRHHFSDFELEMFRRHAAGAGLVVTLAAPDSAVDIGPSGVKTTTLLVPSDATKPELFRITTSLSTKAPAKLIFTAEGNKLGLDEANKTLSSLFRDGFDSTNLFSTFKIVVSKFYGGIRRPLTGNTDVSSELLREAIHYHRWSTATYGSLLLAHQTGRNWFKDAFRLNSDSKAAVEFLGIDESDMLHFHKDDNDFYDPQYFLALDRTNGFLVLAVRGTFDPMSALTDLASDVCLFKDGCAHLGWLRSAMLAYNREFRRVMKWVEGYKPRGLMFTGHSYGAAVTSLLTILFSDALPELRRLSGREDFTIQSHIYGAPPVISPNIAARFEGVINAWEHEDDNVASISMGALYDLRDLIALADFHIARKSTREVALMDLKRLREELLRTGKNPKLVVPGKVFYLYQTEPRSESLGKRTYRVEMSTPEHFHELILRQLAKPHFPHSYAVAMAKGLETLEGKGYGKGGRKARTAEEYWRDPWKGKREMDPIKRIEVKAAGLDRKTGKCDCVECSV